MIYPKTLEEAVSKARGFFPLRTRTCFGTVHWWRGRIDQQRTYAAAAESGISQSTRVDLISAMQKRGPRQSNVQQQNAHVERSLHAEASYWRQHGLPPILARVGVERGVQWEKSIVIELSVDFPGMPSIFGELVTQDQRFIAFEIDTMGEVRVERWADVTNVQNLSEQNRGTGVGRGALALRVLRDLNA